MLCLATETVINARQKKKKKEIRLKMLHPVTLLQTGLITRANSCNTTRAQVAQLVTLTRVIFSAHHQNPMRSFRLWRSKYFRNDTTKGATFHFFLDRVFIAKLANSLPSLSVSHILIHATWFKKKSILWA